MVLGTLGLLVVTAIPTTVGVGQAISAQKRQNEAEKEKVKFGIGITITIDGKEEEAQGVLADGKLYIDHSASPVKGVKFSGWYFGYPGEEDMMGMVTFTSVDPPALGWMFVDADTRVVRYGGRKETVDHVVGTWHWTPNEKFVTLRGSGEGFVAIREDEEGEKEGRFRWAVYWDPDGGLREQKGEERCKPVALHRQMALGMESRYVRD